MVAVVEYSLMSMVIIPSAALRGVKTRQRSLSAVSGSDSTQGVGQSSSFIILTKNIQSLLSDAREREFFAELQVRRWDAVLISEIWREKRRERWKTEEGHMFFGSGGSRGEKGTGLILHRRWVSNFRAFHAVNHRVCAVDFDARGHKLRLVAVYMPHGGCDDEEVEGIYGELSQLARGAAALDRACILAGDWNAVVGSSSASVDDNVLGPYGVGDANERGEWLTH